MANRTITALYEQKAGAERARNDLQAAGIADVDIHDQAGSDAAGGHQEGFMESLRNMFGGHEDTHSYGEGLRRGHVLLTAKVDESKADETVRILESSNAVDFDRTQEAWRGEGWAGAPATGVGGSTTPAPARNDTGGEAEEVIPVVEEQLRVGKREVERGGVRVRSYIVETPVHDSIGLREEHVSIERRPVDRHVTDADAAAFKDRDISMTERAEEAVIAKDAVVREEIVVRKDTTERTQEIDEKLRRTEVEVDDTTERGARR